MASVSKLVFSPKRLTSHSKERQNLTDVGLAVYLVISNYLTSLSISSYALYLCISYSSCTETS